MLVLSRGERSSHGLRCRGASRRRAAGRGGRPASATLRTACPASSRLRRRGTADGSALSRPPRAASSDSRRCNRGSQFGSVCAGRSRSRSRTGCSSPPTLTTTHASSSASRPHAYVLPSQPGPARNSSRRSHVPSTGITSQRARPAGCDASTWYRSRSRSLSGHRIGVCELIEALGEEACDAKRVKMRSSCLCRLKGGRRDDARVEEGIGGATSGLHGGGRIGCRERCRRRWERLLGWRLWRQQRHLTQLTFRASDYWHPHRTTKWITVVIRATPFPQVA